MDFGQHESLQAKKKMTKQSGRLAFSLLPSSSPFLPLNLPLYPTSFFFLLYIYFQGDNGILSNVGKASEFFVDQAL